MAQQVTPQIVAHVAKLAKLSLPDAQLPQVALDLARVLELVAVLDEVDVNGVEPLIHPHELPMPLRQDLPQPSLPQPDALANAPQQVDGYFQTPRVIG